MTHACWFEHLYFDISLLSSDGSDNDIVWIWIFFIDHEEEEEKECERWMNAAYQLLSA